MTAIADVSSYRSIVGDLQYLTMTRRLCMLLTKFGQFMHQPRTSHLAAVKRILRYI